MSSEPDLEKTYSPPSPPESVREGSDGSGTIGRFEKKGLTSGKRYDRWYDAFKPASFKQPTDDELPFDTEGLTKREILLERLSRSSPPLSRRHLIVITASACVGTGLFIGTGSTLNTGGPAALLIGFAVVGIGMLLTMQTTAELGLRYPTVSPFSELTTKFVDNSWGFTIGWIYFATWMVTAPLEMIAAGMLSQFPWWQQNPEPPGNPPTGGAGVNPVAWVAIIYVVEVSIHLFGGSRGYAEAEFAIGCIKVSATIAWIFYAVIYNCGGIPGWTNNGYYTDPTDASTFTRYVGNDPYFDHHTYIGGHYWVTNPGPFLNAFKGVATVMVSAAFAYGGTEVTGLAAAETANPLRAIPSSTRQTAWRIVIFFGVAIVLCGLNVPYDDHNIGSGGEGSGSIFVAMLMRAGTHALPSLMNAVIMFSVFGVANAALYAGARCMVALVVSGYAPMWKYLNCGYIDRHGRPLVAQLIMGIFSLLCFVCASDQYNEVFNWLYAFVELGFLYVWSAICFAHIKFRLAMRRQGRSLDELAFKAPLGVPGSIIAGGIWVFIFGINFWTAAAPALAKGAEQLSTQRRAITFFQQDLSVPMVMIVYIGHKIYSKRTTGKWGFVGFDDIDLDEGVRDLDWDMVEQEEADAKQRAKKNFFIRLGHIFC